MKPLLRRAPLTFEDWCIWQRFELGPATWFLYECSIPSDRRDAALMLSYMRSLPPTRGLESHGSWVILMCAQWWTK